MHARAVFALWGAAVLCASCGAADRDALVSGVPLVQPLPGGSTPGRPVPRPARIRVCTYNIQNFGDGQNDPAGRTAEQARRQARLAAALLSQIRPDIILVQEVENARALAMLNRHFAVPYPVAHATDFGDGGKSYEPLNLGVLSRIPLEQRAEIDFGPLRGRHRPPRGLLRFVVDLGDGRLLLVYNVHLKSNWGNRARNVAKRRHALRLLREDVRRVRQQRNDAAWEILVAGDMNTDPAASSFRDDRTLAELKGWTDLWRGRASEERVTLPTRYGDERFEFPPAAFDRFVVSPELTRAPWQTMPPRTIREGVHTNVFALPGGHEGHISDHYPAFVDLVPGP